MGHLRDNNTSYLRHLAFALSLSLALFIHAFIPSVLQTYVSDRICKNKNKIKLDDIKSSDYF
jgi:hypothetical protein